MIASLNASSISRAGMAAMSAFVTTFVLLLVMQYLIKIGDSGIVAKSTEPFVISFIKELRPDTPPPLRDRTRKPPEPKQAPPTPRIESSDKVIIGYSELAIGAPAQELPGPTWSAIAQSDGEPISIVKVQPVYPQRAVMRNIEGYTVVEYTITTTGQTRDIRVIRS